MSTLHLMVGLPGAGKTTRARELAERTPALRLTPDEWMAPLFGDNDADGARDVLEGRLVTTALRVLRLRVDVVLDFGLWGRDERSALHQLALDQGAACSTEYLPVDPETQWQRVQERWAAAREQTFPMTRADLVSWRERFQPPDAVELSGVPPPPPPAPWPTWPDWAVERWPSLEVR